MNKHVISFSLATAAWVMMPVPQAAAQVFEPLTESAARLAVGEINIKGNSQLQDEQIARLLRSLGIVKGNPLSQAALQKVQQVLQKQYISQGYHASDVQVGVRRLNGNRAAVDVNIKEGGQARIRQVDFVGNKAFPDNVLLGQLESGPRGFLSVPYFSTRDKFSREKMIGDLERLNSFYRDRGFIKFKVVDTDIKLTEDKQGVNVRIVVEEGPQYRLGDVQVLGTGLSQAQIAALVPLRRGQVFSQKNLEVSRKNLSEALGKQGFAFTSINARPNFDEASQTVGVALEVKSGKRTYVRRINIRGNNRTRDEVYRREIRQLESAPFSQAKVEQSRTRLRRLPYVEGVSINLEPVAGTKDQVDLTVVIKERSSNQFRIGAGYSQSGGVLFNASLSQDNFMGTGKELDIAIDNSSANKNLRISYNNPYFTPEGIGRGFSAYYNKYDAGEEDISTYRMNKFGADMRFSIPVGEDNAFHIRAGAERRELILGDSPADHIRDFAALHGGEYDQFPATFTFAHDSRDRGLFPTKGQRHRLSLMTALPGSDLEYYKINYRGAIYRPVTDDITFAIKAKVGAGKGSGDNMDDLPFFEKYTAGGIGTVRGFERNSLGPKDSNDDNMGGDALFAASAELQFPMPFLADMKNLKMSAFVDAGNVFKDTGDFETDQLRVSAGLGAVWISPFGPLEISWAKPLNEEEGDDLQEFQFSLGASF